MRTFHTVCSTIDFQPAFHDMVEGAELFRRVGRATRPALLALCVMPDHVHVVTTVPAHQRLRAVLSGYTRWRHHRRGGAGRLFSRVPEPLERTGTAKILRDQRYVELNPCRAGIVDDPLAWPLSTWRDRMGLAWPLMRPKARDPARWHAYATRDDYATAEPPPTGLVARSPKDVVDAVTNVLRLPPERRWLRGPTRTLLVASLRELTDLQTTDIADVSHLSASQVRRVPPAPPGLDVIRLVAGDPRFPAMECVMPDLLGYRRARRRNASGPDLRWR